MRVGLIGRVGRGDYDALAPRDRIRRREKASMFGGLLFVRIKAAEQALRDGRLDDAFRTACEPDVAGHSRGARLLAGLADAFVARAREHYRAERFTEALLDLGKADRCGGREKESAELRGQVLAVAQEVARQEGDRKRRLEEARRCVQGGSLAAGERLLQSVAGDDAEIQKLQKEVAAQAKRAAELVAQAEGFFKRDRLDAAVEHLVRARSIDAGNSAALQLESLICDAALKEARLAFDAGRLAAARTALARLKSLGKHHGEIAELAELLEQARRASDALAAGQFDAVQPYVRRLQGLSPKTGWIKEAAQQLERLDAALLSLRGGPLGDGSAGGALVKPADLPLGLRETVAIGRQVATSGDASLLPRQLLLLVDGGGSYLLHRSERAGVGRVTTDHPADVPIFSDLGAEHADIARVEEDYFLMSPHEVEVGGRRTRHQLLRDGDRVVLARRAKFTFRLPNRKSPSACLDISDSTRMPNDVRRVVLYKDTAMIGRGPACHVTCHAAKQDLVLYERGGDLWVRPLGRGGGEAQRIEIGRSVELEGVSFVVQPWAVRPTGTL